MTQAPGAVRIPLVVDYERTLILAIELSNTSWVLAAQIPGLPGVKAKRSIKPTPEALMAAIDGYRVRAEKAGRNVNRVIAVYGAGWSGFWLVRWLAKYGIETHVIQPSSVPVDRRARRGGWSVVPPTSTGRGRPGRSSRWDAGSCLGSCSSPSAPAVGRPSQLDRSLSGRAEPGMCPSRACEG